MQNPAYWKEQDPRKELWLDESAVFALEVDEEGKTRAQVWEDLH
jgi:hypothetical protein